METTGGNANTGQPQHQTLCVRYSNGEDNWKQVWYSDVTDILDAILIMKCPKSAPDIEFFWSCDSDTFKIQTIFLPDTL